MAGVGNTGNHFLSGFLWGSFGGGGPPSASAPARTWWDTASDLWEAAKWIFSALRDSYITCYRSPNLDSPDDRARAQLEEMRSLWFPETISLSCRMENREFVIQRFTAHPKVEGIITAFFQRQGSAKPEDLTVERFFREHVFTLPYDQTVTLPNPEPKQAFWKSKQDLKRDLEALVDSLAEKGTQKLEDDFTVLNDRLRDQNQRALEQLEKDNPQREELNQAYAQNLLRERAAKDQKIQEHKASVSRELFGEEMLDNLAANPQKLLDSLDRYFREHFSEEG